MLHETPALPGFEVSPANLAWVEELYLKYLTDPTQVDEGWRVRFAALDRSGPGAPTMVPPSGGPSLALPFAGVPASVNGHGRAFDGHGVANGTAVQEAAEATIDRALGGKRIRKLIEDYRELGHLATDLDPLGLVDRSKNLLRLEDYGVTEADLDGVVNAEDIGGDGRARPLRDILDRLRETYCRHIGVELAHINDIEIRDWLIRRLEATRNRVWFSRAEQLALLGKVVEAETFESFLQTKFLGAKRFSCEGAEGLIPLMDRAIERAASQGVSQIVIGMAHRGRLNVLANIMGKPPAEIFAEFLDRSSELAGEGGGDVKYHLGYSMDRVTAGGRVHLSLGFNPSHLEWANPVVQGRLRAKQDRMGDRERTRGLPILIHGDAAIAGQGVVAEGFNMSGLEAYTVGGTVHIVINNQIGFTTSPLRSYSSTYCTDVARMLQIPIFHINGEDPEAVAQAVDVAIDFRQRFHRDVIIDMWCYRKLGHNEADEPAFTQPQMYRAIAQKAPVRAAFLAAFARTGTSTGEPAADAGDAEAQTARCRASLEEALEAARKLSALPRPTAFAGVWARMRGGPESMVHEVPTAVPRERLDAVASVLVRAPEGFTPHPKVAKLLETRSAMAAGQEALDFGMAEALAMGSLLAEGVRIRMSGQDVRRGTFSHRHATLVDVESGAEYTALEHVGKKPGMLQIYDSCLSEAGVLGFEYGYSLDMPDGLTIWEAQFGDFVNGAQVIIDQFLVSSEAKWRRVSGLVMLLPHGMEGMGPEHSSARLERFLSMCVNDNIQVCNLTTPAQFFHLLRRQVLRPYRKPLVVMSPKSLLRLRASHVDDLVQGRFQHVIPDGTTSPAEVDRVLLCSGKVYYDLIAAREALRLRNVAIIRVEQLYPLRREEILEALSEYREGIRVAWVQEEARNMGAWHYMDRELPPLIKGTFRWSGISRFLSASPATGSSSRHDLEQGKLLEDALGVPAGSIVVSKGQVKVDAQRR